MFLEPSYHQEKLVRPSRTKARRHAFWALGSGQRFRAGSLGFKEGFVLGPASLDWLLEPHTPITKP